MRLLFSITYYSPYISGLTLYAKRLAEYLVKSGHEVDVLCMRHNNKISLTETIEGVHVDRAQPLLALHKGFLSIDWIAKSIKKMAKYNVLIVHLPQFEGFIPAIVAKLFGKKVISVYHCEVNLPGGITTKLIEKILLLVNLLTLRLSDHIITSSEDFANFSKALTLFKNKITYIYPPTEIPIINKRVQKYINKRIDERPDYIIGFAGRLASEKGIEYLLQAIPILKEKLSDKTFKIVIVGPQKPVGEAAYEEKIDRLVQQFRKEIIFLGTIEGNFMGTFYSLIDVLVLPSVNSTEAFGMVQVEAMMMGKPVVVSNLPGVRVPVMKTGAGLIVPIRSSAKIADALQEVLTNKKKYIIDKRKIKNEFSINRTIIQYQTLINFVYG